MNKYSTTPAWRALRLFSYYRIILSGFLLILIASGHLPAPFGAYAKGLFMVAVIGLLGSAIFLLLLVRFRRPAFRQQVFIQVFVDFIAFGVMMYASSGVSSGIGLLIVMSVAAGSLLLMGRTAFLFAAIGALVILVVEVLVLLNDVYQPNFTTAGLLGAVLFATASLAHTLAKRIRESEALAAQRGQDLVSLSRMNARIIQRMRSGLLVLDRKGVIRMANVSATRFLGINGRIEGMPLIRISTELYELLKAWLKGNQATSLLKVDSGPTEMQVSFTYLGQEGDSDILIFLEDAATMRQKAQQLKLASLGQLTASIAHEIRNPLGAISHAGQLLSESSKLDEADQRLLQIIRDHSTRVNLIIENILRLGRRDDSVPESFLIKPWLEQYVTDFCLQHQLSETEMIHSVEPENIRVTMDQSQLHQILTNLCENALRYSQHDPKVVLRCSVSKGSERPCLDIIDQGPGISEERMDQIFEPFFTDRSGGTGLGLYIAKELCEANQAILVLHKNTENGCCFRIIFAHPDKQIHIE